MAKDNIVYVYVDEFGTPDLILDKEGNEPLFIYAAVVIPESELEKARNLHLKIVQEYFQRRFIKSAHISNDGAGFSKIVNVLTELKSLKHFVIALIIDKENVFNHPGLSIKQIFIKYFQKLLSKSIIEVYDEFHIYFDKTGYPEFIVSLKEYLSKEVGLGANLFSNNTFDVADDVKEEPLIQFADFYAGALGKCYCNKFNANRVNVIHDFVKRRLSFSWFPKETIPIVVATDGFGDTFDFHLFNQAVETAEKYIEENSEDIVGCELLSYYIQEANRRPFRYISSKEIKAYLKNKGIEIGDPIVKISELRDEGVVLISPIGMKGYKFPVSEKEVADFLNRLSHNVIPQLRRGRKINDILAKKTIGSCNVLKRVSSNC